MVRYGGAAIAVSAALGLSACQYLGEKPASGATAGTVPPAAPTRPVPPPSDPVLAFVARALPGEATSLDDPARGRVEIRLEREYYSADGVTCRRFSLSQHGALRTRVACRQPDGWQLDRILEPGPRR